MNHVNTTHRNLIPITNENVGGATVGLVYGNFYIGYGASFLYNI